MCAPIAANAAGPLTVLVSQIIAVSIIGGFILANFGETIRSRILVTFRGSM